MTPAQRWENELGFGHPWTLGNTVANFMLITMWQTHYYTMDYRQMVDEIMRHFDDREVN